jgi:hypothetical protein
VGSSSLILWFRTQFLSAKKIFGTGGLKLAPRGRRRFKRERKGERGKERKERRERKEERGEEREERRKRKGERGKDVTNSIINRLGMSIRMYLPFLLERLLAFLTALLCPYCSMPY